MTMTQILLIAGILFLAPLVTGVVGGIAAVAGGATDLATRQCRALIRLCAIAAAAASVTMLWSSAIVWIVMHTIILQGVPPALCYVLMALLGLMPSVDALYGLSECDEPAASQCEPVERPALMIAAILNAVFLGVVLV